MKKIFALFVALFLTTLTLAGPASATSTAPSGDNKKIEICHATGSERNPYNLIEVSVGSWLEGHKFHEDDIWEAFSYTTVGGTVVNVPAQGNTDLLATDCVVPKVDTKIAKPEAVYLDKCETKDDVFAVAPGTGYTVGNVVQNDDGTQSITVTLLDGFVWLDGSKTPVTITKPGFTNVDCDLPETGGVQTAVSAGIGSLVALMLAAGLFVMVGRRNTV